MAAMNPTMKDDTPEFAVLLGDIAKIKSAQVGLANSVGKAFKAEQADQVANKEMADAIESYAKVVPEELAVQIAAVCDVMRTMEAERDTVIKAMVGRLLRPTQQYLSASAAKIEERRGVYEKQKTEYLKKVDNMTKKAEKAGRKVEKMQEQMKELVATKRSYDEMVDSLKTEISNITHGHDVALMEAVSAIMDSQLQYHGQCYALLSNIQANFKALPDIAKRAYDPNRQYEEEEAPAAATQDYNDDYTYDQYADAPPPPPPGAGGEDDYYDEAAPAPPPPAPY